LVCNLPKNYQKATERRERIRGLEVRRRIGNDEEGEKERGREEEKVEATFETQRAAKMKSSAFLPFEKFVIRLQNFSWILARKKILEAATEALAFRSYHQKETVFSSNSQEREDETLRLYVLLFVDNI
ncbi:hypothetical protein V1477_006777, partial [Vespula maculifrons]